MKDDTEDFSNFSGGSPTAFTLKILVIDDEPDVADIAGALLGAYGIAHRVVYSAKEGLHAIENDARINAVFSDIMMPAMTGLELADVVRARYPWIRMVLTSGFTAPQLLAAHAKYYAFLPKPYKIEALIALLSPKR